MDVYDFKGKGVAMSMYNTDEVNPAAFCHDATIDYPFLVNNWICTLIIQDGSP
jgi:hypothetical protein